MDFIDSTGLLPPIGMDGDRCRNVVGKGKKRGSENGVYIT